MTVLTDGAATAAPHPFLLLFLLPHILLPLSFLLFSLCPPIPLFLLLFLPPLPPLPLPSLPPPLFPPPLYLLLFLPPSLHSSLPSPSQSRPDFFKDWLLLCSSGLRFYSSAQHPSGEVGRCHHTVFCFLFRQLFLLFPLFFILDPSWSFHDFSPLLQLGPTSP